MKNGVGADDTLKICLNVSAVVPFLIKMAATIRKLQKSIKSRVPFVDWADRRGGMRIDTCHGVFATNRLRLIIYTPLLAN